MNSDIGKVYFSDITRSRRMITRAIEKKEVYVSINTDVQCIGFMWYMLNRTFGMYPYLHVIAVKEENRNMGIGRQLMQLTNNCDSVESSSITDGENAEAYGGNLRMTVADNSNYDTDVTDAVDGAASISTVSSVNIELDNIVSKGDGDCWTSSVTEFENDITVGLTLDDADLVEGESYSVVRDHNGTLTELVTDYDAATGTLTFPTNQFSTYTIVKKAAAKPEQKNKKNYEEGIGDTKIPETLKNKGLDSEIKIKAAMVVEVAKTEDYTDKNTKLYEVTLMISTDGGETYVPATRDNFPNEGIIFTITYPERTNGENFKFIITHMLTAAIDGKQSGDIECLQ